MKTTISHLESVGLPDDVDIVAVRLRFWPKLGQDLSHLLIITIFCWEAQLLMSYGVMKARQLDID